MSNSSEGQPAVFYIQSNIGNSDWVVARNGDRLHLEHRSGSLGQLWRREDDPRGGMFIINVETNQVMDWAGGRGQDVTLKPKNLGSPNQLWVARDVGGGSHFLYAANWNQALDVFGNGPYDERSRIGLWEASGSPQANELWKLIPDRGEIKVVSIQYDMSQAKVNLDMPPALGVATAVDNRFGSVTLSTQVELTRTVTTQRQFTYNESSAETVKTARTLGYKLGIEKVVEVSAQVAVENTTSTSTSITDQSVEALSKTDKLQVSVQVPPKAQYEYVVRVHYGSVSVPYRATVSRQLPNGQTQLSEITGTYTNVNMVKFDIVGNDVTEGAPKPLQAPFAPEMVVAPPMA